MRRLPVIQTPAGRALTAACRGPPGTPQRRVVTLDHLVEQRALRPVTPAMLGNLLPRGIPPCRVCALHPLDVCLHWGAGWHRRGATVNRRTACWRVGSRLPREQPAWRWCCRTAACSAGYPCGAGSILPTGRTSRAAFRAPGSLPRDHLLQVQTAERLRRSCDTVYLYSTAEYTPLSAAWNTP
jgi:hypothetical protein